jgi:hypothetical protein
LPLSKVPRSYQPEDINAQEVFLENAGDIYLEIHQNHRPFLILSVYFFWDVTGSEFKRHIFIESSQQGFHAWASTCHLWSQSHKSCDLNWFCMQSAIMFTISIG